MARGLTICRRCSFRCLILMLAAAYFFAMSIFFLQWSDGPPADGWDKMEIGADAHVSMHHNPLRGILRDSDRQQAFDNMRRQQRPALHRDIQKSSRDAHFRPTVSGSPEGYRKLVDLRTATDKRIEPLLGSLDNENIPLGCQDFGDESEFKFQNIASDIFLFSAFWDSRPNDFDNRQNGTYIRIMTIIRSGARPELYCSFESEPKYGSPKTSRISYYEMCENHGRVFGGFILSCFVPTAIVIPPCWVTISKFRDNTASESVFVRIRTIDPVPRRWNFAICVPPLFGSVSIPRLVEFLEVSRILGAEHVTLYDLEMTEELRTIVDYYFRERGFVSVVPWKLPKRIDDGIWYHGQSIAIHDCLYRSMASTNYVAFNDIDEFVVPQTVSSWSQLIELIDKPNRCGFHFKSAYFKPESLEDSSAELDIQTLVNFERTSNFNRIRTKCMVKPLSIFEKGIHHVSKPILADLEVFGVEPRVAFLHHYRVCIHGMGMNCAAFEEDSNMLRYKDKIVSAVNSTKLSLKATLQDRDDVML